MKPHGTKSLWGYWLPEFVEALKTIEPTQEEKAILRKAREIQAEYKARIAALLATRGNK